MGTLRWERWAYTAQLDRFLSDAPYAILGELTERADFPVEYGQKQAWLQQITLLREVLAGRGGRGALYFEYAIPRLGKRVDVVLILEHVLFVLEFKVGDRSYASAAIDQVWDYALDLKHFHEPSHGLVTAPVLIATLAPW